MLAQLAERDPDRPVAVCRELTKLHEEVRRGTAAELAAHYAEQSPRGEVVLVVGAVGVSAADPASRDRIPSICAARTRSRRCANWSTPAPARGRPRRSWRS